MKFPSLVKSEFCKTRAYMTLYGEDITEDGAPVTCYDRRELFPQDELYPMDRLYSDYLICEMGNYEDSARVIFTDQQRRVEVTGTLLFDGDICPELSVISGGYVFVFGARREIARGTKARNPDGTVNYTKLELM